MATWKKVIVSGSNAVLNQVTASGGFSGDGSGLTGIVGTSANNFTDADHSKLNAIEASADVTDTTNVTAAGALMDSELTSIANVKALNQSVISGATPTFTATNFTDASNKRFMSNAQETKLDSVESSADVTDTTNVTAAGALMDSELTNLAAVKAINQSLVSGATPTFTATNFTDASDKRFMSNAQETKLDRVESSADVTDATNVTAAGALMDSEVASLALIKGLTAAAISGSVVGQLPAVGDGGLTTNDFTNADHSKLNAIEASADVTDATNVTAAGALMDSELTNLAAVKAINQSLVSGATPTFTATNFTDASNKRFMSNAQETKLDSVEASADVTDTTNVTAAGALMDSELTNLAAVKAINQGLATGNDVAFNKLTLAGDLIVNGTTTTLATTNLSIEDKFITIASGSTSATDGGLVVSKQANGAGFGFGYDTATTRWVFDNDLAVAATGIVADAFVGTVQLHASAAPSANPVYGADNGFGTMHVKTNTGDIYIYA